MYPIYPKRETQGRSEKFIGEWLKIREIKYIYPQRFVQKSQEQVQLICHG